MSVRMPLARDVCTGVLPHLSRRGCLRPTPSPWVSPLRAPAASTTYRFSREEVEMMRQEIQIEGW